MAAVAQLVRVPQDCGMTQGVANLSFILYQIDMYYVYIIKGDNRYYTGYTSDIEKRMVNHKKGGTKTTRHMGKLELIGYFIKDTKTEALILEKMIKKNGHIDHWINHTTFIRYGGCSSVG